MIYGSSTSHLNPNSGRGTTIKRIKSKLDGPSRRPAIQQPDYIVFQRDIQRDSQPRRYGGPLIVQSQENDSPVTKTSNVSTNDSKFVNSRGGWIKRDHKKVRVFEDIDSKGNRIVGEEVPFSSEDEDDGAYIDHAPSAKTEGGIGQNERPKYTSNDTKMKTIGQNLQNFEPVQRVTNAECSYDTINFPASDTGSIEVAERRTSSNVGAHNVVPISLEYSSDESIVENSLDPDDIVREHVGPLENNKTKGRGAYKKRKVGARISSFKSECTSQECSINVEVDESMDRDMLRDNTYIGNCKRRKRRRKVQQDISSMFSRKPLRQVRQRSCAARSHNKPNVRHIDEASPKSNLRNTRRRKKSKLALNNSARKRQITTLDAFVLKKK